MIPMVRHGVFGSTLQQGFTRQARGCLTAVKENKITSELSSKTGDGGANMLC